MRCSGDPSSLIPTLLLKERTCLNIWQQNMVEIEQDNSLLQGIFLDTLFFMFIILMLLLLLIYIVFVVLNNVLLLLLDCIFWSNKILSILYICLMKMNGHVYHK